MPNTDSLTPGGDFAVLIPQGAYSDVAPIPLKRPLTVIGSRRDVVKLHLDSTTVSKAHCAIVANDWGCYIHDLGSRTHTWVNGEDVKEKDLADGDLIKIGRFVFKYIAAKKPGPRREPIEGELLVSTLTDALPITGRVVQIGRRKGSDLQFDDSKVSNVHALMFVCNDKWMIRDLGSRTGVRVNNEFVRQTEVDDGTRIKIGGATLTFRHRAHDQIGEDLNAPITLGKAAPGAPAAEAPLPIEAEDSQLGIDLAAESIAAIPLEPLDLAEAPAEPDSMPSADALASLRRGWRSNVPGEVDETLAEVPAPRPHEPAAPPPAAKELPAEPPKPDQPSGHMPVAEAPKSEPVPYEPPVPQPHTDSTVGLAAEESIADVSLELPLADVAKPAAPAPAAEATPPTPAEPESHEIDLAPLDLEPLELDEDVAIDLTVPAAVAPLPADEAVAEAPKTIEPLIDEVPPAEAGEAEAVEETTAEPIAEPIAEAPPHVERPAAPVVDVAPLELEPLELDDLELPTVADEKAPFPADEAAPVEEAQEEEVSAAAEPVAEAPGVETPAEKPSLELEPLELDDDAELDLAAETKAEAFPADEAVEEIGQTTDPILNDLKPAAEPELPEIPAAEAPPETPAAPVAEAPIEEPAEEPELALDLEPLELDEDAELDLAVEAEADTFPADADVDEVAVAIDPLTEEPLAPAAAEPEATPLAEAPAAPETEAKLDLEDLDLELETAPAAEVAPLDEDAVADLLAEPVAEKPAEETREEAPAAEAPAEEPTVETPLEIAEVAIPPETHDEELGDEPEPISELADIEFDFETEEKAEAEGEPQFRGEAEPVEAEPAPVAEAPLAPEAAPSGEQVEPELEGLLEEDEETDLLAATIRLETSPAGESLQAEIPPAEEAEAEAPAETIAEAPAETSITLDEEEPAGATAEHDLGEEWPGDLKVNAAVVSDEDAAKFLEEPEPPLAEAPTESAAEIAAETIELDVDRRSGDEQLLELEAEPTDTAVPVEPTKPILQKPVEPDHVEDEEPEFEGLSLESADEEDEEPAVIDAAADTATALDLSAFIDREAAEDEHEWEDAPPAPEPVIEAGHDKGPGDDAVPPPQGGTLRDLIPQNPPLIGGMFTPEAPMLIGGSPVVNFAPPPSPFGPQPKRRPLRVGFNRGNKPSPFAAGEKSTIADAVAGQGHGALAGSVDAFATPSPTAEEIEAIAKPSAGGSVNGIELIDEAVPAPVDDAAAAEAFVETAAPSETAIDKPLLPAPSEEAEIEKVAELFRPRNRVTPGVPSVNFDNGSPFATGLAVQPEYDPVHAAQVRKKRYRRIITLVVGALVVVPVGAWVTWQTSALKPYSTIDAMITYDGLDRLGTEDARNFRATQNGNLQSEQIRQNAITALPASVNFGFLGDPQQIAQTINRDPTIEWPTDQPNVMRLRIQSFDKAADRARLLALAQSLVAASAGDQTKLDSTRGLIKNLTDTIDEKKRQLNDTISRLQALQQAGNTRPDLQQISKLKADRDRAENELTTIKGQRQELEAALQVLQRPGSVQLPAPTQIDAAKSDQELTALTQKLSELQKQSESDKANADSRTAAARKALDETIAGFQKDLQGAQQLKQSPELAAYVDAANRIFIQTRELTEDLIRRQENQRTRLSELRARLMEKIDAATKERLAKDDELKKLRDRLDIETRQYNAAVAEGDVVDAKKMELDIALVKSLIGGREDLAKNDPVYNDAIDQLQKIIDTTEQSILDDRKHIDETLTKVQADFSKNAPAVQQLPDEQKKLADSIDKKLLAVNDARKAYDSAADQAQAAQAKIEQQNKAKAAELQLQIAARRQEIADAAAAKSQHDAEAARQQKIADTQTKLADVRQQEQKAQLALDTASAAIDSAERQRKAFIDSDLARNQLTDQRATLEKDLKGLNTELAARTSEVSRLITPDRKVEIQSYDEPDRRPIYAAGVGGGLFVLLMLPVLWTLMLTSRDAHHGHLPPAPPQPSSPPNEGFEPVMGEEVEEEAEKP